jgi:hypothetical protein
LQELLFPKFNYYLDESDPDLVILRRQDGSFVAAFSARGATREGIVEVAREDYRETRRGMVDSTLEAWVGKVVQLWAVGEDEPWLGVLEGWNERGVLLRYSQEMVCFEASRGDRKLSPMVVLFPWSVVRFVGVDLEELEGNHHPPDRP